MRRNCTNPSALKKKRPNESTFSDTAFIQPLLTAQINTVSNISAVASGHGMHTPTVTFEEWKLT